MPKDTRRYKLTYLADDLTRDRESVGRIHDMLGPAPPPSDDDADDDAVDGDDSSVGVGPPVSCISHFASRIDLSQFRALWCTRGETDKQLGLICKGKPMYRRVGRPCALPWVAMAADNNG